MRRYEEMKPPSLPSLLGWRKTRRKGGRVMQRALSMLDARPPLSPYCRLSIEKASSSTLTSSLSLVSFWVGR